MTKTTTQYEDLIIEFENDIEVYELKSMVNKGLYADGIIYIRKDLSNTEKTCLLAEEIGHYETSTGNILNQKDVRNKKQEVRARRHGHDKLVQLNQLIDAFKNACRNRYELAEFLGVTEEFLEEAIEQYKQIYGSFAVHDDYIIYFEPLGVMRIFE